MVGISRAIIVFGLLAEGAAAWVLAQLEWAGLERILHVLPFQCPLKTWFGLRCLSCGLTHAGIAFLRGEWVMAWDFNPLIYGVVPLAHVGALWFLYRGHSLLDSSKSVQQ